MAFIHGLHHSSLQLIRWVCEEYSRCRFWWLSIIQGDGEEKSMIDTEAEKQWDGAWVVTSVKGMKY